MPIPFKPGPPLTEEQAIKMGAKLYKPGDLTPDLSPEAKEIFKRAVNQYRKDLGKEPLFLD